MALKIIRNDITKMKVDVIVNTANEQPKYDSGTDTAVYKAAGEEELLAERSKIGYMKEGEVAITSGFGLPAKYIIYAVSPYYIDGTCGEEQKLRECYQKSLNLAHENGCRSIAFPLIATGSFGYPKEKGMRIALDEINAFLIQHDMLIYLVVFDEESTRLGGSLYPDLQSYIDHNYVCDRREEEYGDRYYDAVLCECFGYEEDMPEMSRMPEISKASEESEMCDLSELTIESEMSEPAELSERNFFDEECWEEHESALNERMKHMTDTFCQYLLYLIEAKGFTNKEVYERAIIKKQLFSKIKVNPDYHPDKATAMRLCIGAKLDLDETKELLARAGYALSPCDKRDIIFSFFIERRIYDMIEIDIVLEECGLPCFIS